MKSDVYELVNSPASLSAILAEVEKVASYTNLDKKAAGRLRLMAEELIGMLPELLTYASGHFWVEAEGNKYELHTSMVPNSSMTMEKREKLLSVSSSGKNEAGKGIMSKICIAAQLLMVDCAQFSVESGNFYDMGRTWSLEAYRTFAEQKKGDDWDELEKSIIANIADDVVVCIQGNKVEVIVKKTFK